MPISTQKIRVVFEGPSGLELRTSDAKTYSIEGGPSSIKVGDLVQFHGSKVKKTKDVHGDQVFRVKQLKKDYGPCKVATKPQRKLQADEAVIRRSLVGIVNADMAVLAV